MKKAFKTLAITLVVCLTLSVIPFTVRASEPEEASTPSNWDEIGYESINEITIVPSAATDDTTVIQEALDQAIGKDDTILTQITIPAGEYITDRTLYIYSNTRLILEDGAVIKRSDNYIGGEMLLSGVGLTANSPAPVFGYDAIHNVFIEGGTWDANKNLADHNFDNILVFTHANNMIFKNVTIVDAVNHMINISGCNKILVDNCTFKDFQVFTGDDVRFYGQNPSEADKAARLSPIETIHMDFMNEAGEPGSAYTLDGTPCRNITVKNCTFDNVFRGLGTHHTMSPSPNDTDYATDYADKIVVENNTFKDVRATCISGYSFKNMVIRNNTATNVGSFCDFIDAHDSLISGNSITGTVAPTEYENYVNVFSPLFLRSSSGITISGNTIASDDKIHSNIMITASSSDIAIDSNTLSGTNTTCVYAKDSNNIVINNISLEKKNSYSTNGENEVFLLNSSATIGYESFSKNICVSQSSATVSNCTLDGGYILLSKAHKTEITNNTINTKDKNITACVLVQECDGDITLSGNTFSTEGMYCTYTDNMIDHNVSISGNTFLKASQDMVFVANSNKVTVSNNIINNSASTYKRAINVTNCNISISTNQIDKYSETGIVIKGKSTASICGNTVNGGANALQIFEGSTVTVARNTLQNTTSYPLQVNNSTGTFESNKISGSGDVGILFTDCNNLTINKNTISDTVSHGMYLSNVNTATVSNNTFSNIPVWKCNVRVADNCKNVTVTPESDTEWITPEPSNPSTPPTQAPTTPPTQTPTQTPTKAPEKEVSFEDFVERLYVVALERSSEAEGKAYWCEKVKDGTYDGAYCARFFLTSPEFLGKNKTEGEFVDTLYRTFFGREADDEGRNFWIKKIHESSKEAVIEGFINSEEWCNICASYGVKSGAQWAKASVASKNATDFATRLYTECLGRPAEEGGLKYWSLSLTNLERTGSQAAREFFYSDEFIGHKYSNEEYVTRMYKTFMGREPEGDGKAYWIDFLNKGGSRDDMFYFFSTCPEFTEICAKYSIER